MITRRHARQLRAMIEKSSISLPDNDAVDVVELYPMWVVGVAYEVDMRIRYGEKLYRVVQSHTSQADWTPDKTPALFTEVAKSGEIPVWKQPTGAHDAYAKGDKVHYPNKDGSVYVSEIDANVYEPTVYGWREE